MATFNAEAFLNQTVEAQLDTLRAPFPEGEHEDLQIADISFKDGVIGKGENKGKPWVQLNYKLMSTDPNVKAEMNLSDDQDAFIYGDCFLDLDDNGNLDVSAGKNIELGKLRAAAGQNSSEAWSIGDLKGAMIGGAVVGHKFKENGDPYAYIKSLFAAETDED